jgi:hypothetical protein
MTSANFGTGRNREATLITAVLALPCGLACAGSVLPGLDDLVTTILVGLAAVAVLALAARWGARWLRERREDRADALTAARWRAVHAPHLRTPTDRSRIDIHPASTGSGLRAAA